MGEVSVHPGRVQQRFVDELREVAGRVLPRAMAEVVLATEQPYLQTVADVRVPAMADGRIAEEWTCADSLGLMKQLGMLPAVTAPAGNIGVPPAAR